MTDKPDSIISYIIGNILCTMGFHKADEGKINKSWNGRTSIYEYDCVRCYKCVHNEQYYPDL